MSDHTIVHHGYAVHSEGWVEQKRRPGAYLLPHDVKGYLRVTLTLPDGSRQQVLLHVLVAELFIGPKPDGHQVNHKDGDRTNNAASNLEYVTPRANVRHSLDVLGVQRARGEQNSQARLTAELVASMRADHADGLSAAEVGRKYQIDPGHAWRIVTRKSWRHVA